MENPPGGWQFSLSLGIYLMYDLTGSTQVEWKAFDFWMHWSITQWLKRLKHNERGEVTEDRYEWCEWEFCFLCFWNISELACCLLFLLLLWRRLFALLGYYSTKLYLQYSSQLKQAWTPSCHVWFFKSYVGCQCHSNDTMTNNNTMSLLLHPPFLKESWENQEELLQRNSALLSIYQVDMLRICH